MEISRQDVRDDKLQDFGAERFIKIPIENYLELIDIKPNPPQMALINAVNNPNYRFIVAVLNRRTGKSYMSNLIGHLVTLIPGCNILILAPNYSLSAISWDIQRHLIATFDIETERSNAKDKIIELKNGSTIRMGSVSQADSVVGRSYDLIIYDEAALNDDGESTFNIQLRPTLDKPNSKAIFISTPRGKNWFHDFYRRGYKHEDPNFDRWVSIRSTYHDNPRASMEDIEDARATMSKAEFAQEYMSDFIALQGQIYELNRQNIIETDLAAIKKFDVIAGLDMGFRDPTAFVVLISDGVNYYIVDEFKINESSTSKYASKIQEKINDWGIDFIYIDSAHQQTKFDLAYDYDITCTNAKKSVLDGIGYVASLVDHDRIFIDKKCTEVIDMFDNYRWDDKEGLLNERPKHGGADGPSHIADALRYAVYTHAYNVAGIGE
jgi:hypothetical protein